MKNRLSLTTLVVYLCILFFIACKKSDGTLSPVKGASTFSFSANDTMISFPVNLVYIQDVLNVHTTLISGQYADTSSKQGNISIRVIGDTTGRFHGDSLTVTYTNPAGIAYYNTTDTGNFAQIDKFPKTAGGIVSGSFYCKVFHGGDSILFSHGTFMAPYQD